MENNLSIKLKNKILHYLLNSSVKIIDELKEIYDIEKEDIIIECKNLENLITIRPKHSIKEITINFEIKE